MLIYANAHKCMHTGRVTKDNLHKHKKTDKPHTLSHKAFRLNKTRPTDF